MKLLSECGYEFVTSADRNIVENIKEKYSSLILSESEQIVIKKDLISMEKQYTLADGQMLWLSDERFQCSEILFYLAVLTEHNFSRPEKLAQTISNCDRDIQKAAYANIVLSTGTSMFSGFSTRMEKETASIAPSSMEVDVIYRSIESTYSSEAQF